MFILKNEIQFDTAHYLSGYQGKCSNIHGHRYRLVVELASKTLQQEGQQRGMVADFGDVKELLRQIVQQYDHKLLIEDNADGCAVAAQLAQLPNQFAICMVPYRPTAEEMSRDIYYQIKQAGYPVYSVELFETPVNSCIYREV
jgi:6-pyruvoyltetrahydropterin/6-carboxytetrahydropterin synthase